MIFIIITLKLNMLTTQDYYSLIQTVWCMKLKRKMLMNILVEIQICFILAIVGLSQNNMITQKN